MELRRADGNARLFPHSWSLLGQAPVGQLVPYGLSSKDPRNQARALEEPVQRRRKHRRRQPSRVAPDAGSYLLGPAPVSVQAKLKQPATARKRSIF